MNALDEAAWLVLGALGLPNEHLADFYDARLLPHERRRLAALIARRVTEREPTAYLLGEAWLGGLRFRADRRALIPRSLLAECLTGAFPDWMHSQGLDDAWPATILDLCCGGASLAIVAAHCFPESNVLASDASRDALALAAENVADFGLGRRITLRQGDLFEPIEAERRFDLIVCNPPYVCDAGMAALPIEFHREPRGALAGGRDGMDLVRRILAEAPARLSDEGVLLLEIGHEASHFEAAFPRLEFTYLPVAAGEQMVVVISRSQLGAGDTSSSPG